MGSHGAQWHHGNNLLCSKFSQKLWPTECLKLLKTLDVTQIKLVLIGDLSKKNSYLGPIFRGLSLQNACVVFPRATKDEISRYPNFFSTYV